MSLGFDPRVTSPGNATSGGYLCGEAATLDGRTIASTQSRFDDVALVVAGVTDPAAPRVLGELVLEGIGVYDSEVANWTLPVEEGGGDEPLIFSPHYAAVINHTVFVSMYHAGVWAFDANPEMWPHPPTMGVFLPAQASPTPSPAQPFGWGVLEMAPSILEVLALPDGTLVSWDSMAGIHAYRFQPDARVQPVSNWFEG